MFPKLTKRLGALTLGGLLAVGNSVDAQTTGYVNPTPTPTAAPAPAPVSAYNPAPMPAYAPATKSVAPVAAQGPMTSAFAPGCGANDDCAPGVWVNIDYLLWWMKSAPAAGPIVTTGSILDPVPGGFGQPGTVVLLQNDSASNNPFNGIRLEAGTWIDEPRTYGYEASVFTFEQRSTFDGVASDGTGTPFLARPYISAATGQPLIYPVAIPGVFAGAVNTTNSTRVTSWDANALFNFSDDGSTRIDGLVGMRGLFLNEVLQVDQSILALVNQGPAGSNALQQGQSIRTIDRYNTKNTFYGAQLGGRFSRVTTKWVTSATFKLGLGVTDQIADLSGQTTTQTQGQNVGGGVFVNDGNSGRYYRGAFCVIPELDLNVGYRVSQYCTLRVGYTALYVSDVVRPAGTISRTLSPAQIPSLIVPPGTPTAEPRSQLTSTDFWATGLNLGVEFRF